MVGRIVVTILHKDKEGLMEISIIFARFLGLLYVAVGLGLLFNKNYYQKIFSDFLNNVAMLYIGGILALIFGFLLVTYHNVWVGSWVVIITVIGWLALMKGIFILVCPSLMQRFVQYLLNKPKFLQIEGVFALILGLVLGYFGFIS
jgi:uncharacterized protein YjeT (DUF2065 family)